ncbi:hypothetical protein CYMTET_12523 [Cymbomonas tetramitiformis]|uniref:Uncharacterized protein n=1 Tax=Cymbomonas tetramitiformis TaxID=36881 RepID=A0AAE0GKB3_9CHLO|nr:hypothetical protein CYMTET_12523 [Cymbomonas tetramitiformis]
MASASRRSLGDVLRSARATSASPTPASSPGSGSQAPSPHSRTAGLDPVVRMNTLINKPSFISPAATSVDFHRDASVWVSTPVRASQQHEYGDRMDYAFSYGEELVKLLRAHGFKPQKGFTLDGSDAEADFAILLSNLRHVLSPISHFEYDKLFDLEHEYLVYHWSLNELLFNILKGVLQGTALALFQESARVHPRDGRCALQRLRFHVEATTDPDTFRFWTKLRSTTLDETADPAPQLAVFRVLGDKHQRLHPSYDDAGRVQDLHHVLGSTVWQSEGHLARLRSPSTGSGGGKHAPTSASFNSVQRNNIVKPVGDRKPSPRRGHYLVWEGVGYPCVTCFRLWGLTDAHLPTRGVCPYSCAASFAPGQAPAGAPAAPPRPTVDAWLQPPAPPAPAAAAAVHFAEGSPSPQFAPADSSDASAFTLRLPLDHDPPGPEPDDSADHDDDDWPALRTVPWIPPFQGSTSSKID